MKSKKAGFDYQSFEQAALKAMYEGQSLEQALGPLLKRLVETGRGHVFFISLDFN